MTTTLVTDIRTRIRSEERPLTEIERVLLAATILKPATGGHDALDELDAAVVGVRSAFATLNGPELTAVRRLLCAVRAILDATPTTGNLAAVTAQRDGNRGAAVNARIAPHWTDRDDLEQRPAAAGRVEADAARLWDALR